jgi:bacteriocin-like protein
MTNLTIDDLAAVTGGATCNGILVNLGDFVACLGVMIR